MGMFPLLLSNEIEWAREAVAIGAILQVTNPTPPKTTAIAQPTIPGGIFVY